MKTLTLALKAEYFDAIRDGTKTEEYRLANAYWTKRLSNNSYGRIIITKGYPAASDVTRRMMFKWRGYCLRSLTHPHFGPEPVLVFAIDVTERLS